MTIKHNHCYTKTTAKSKKPCNFSGPERLTRSNYSMSHCRNSPWIQTIRPLWSPKQCLTPTLPTSFAWSKTMCISWIQISCSSKRFSQLSQLSPCASMISDISTQDPQFGNNQDPQCTSNTIHTPKVTLCNIMCCASTTESPILHHWRPSPYVLW